MARKIFLTLLMATVVALLAAPMTHHQPAAQAKATDVLGISPSLCFALLLNTQATGVEILTLKGDCEALDSRASLHRVADCDHVPSVCALTKRGDADGEIEPADFEGLDMDGNQLHQKDSNSRLWIVAFVNDTDPVRFDTTLGKFRLPDNSLVDDFVCDAAHPYDNDCLGGPVDDGVVVAELTPFVSPGVSDDLGAGTVEILQEGYASYIDFTIVGEPDEIEFMTLETTIQNGISDIGGGDSDGIDNDGDCTDDTNFDGVVCGPGDEGVDEADERGPNGSLGDDGECPLAATTEGFLGALGEPEKTIVVARVKDSEGTDITNAFVSWGVDDEDKAVTATDLTPTIDLGAFGFGAPNILCGTDEPGTVEVTATMTAALSGLTLDPWACGDPAGTARCEDNSVEFTVAGLPADIALTAEPESLVCDGVNASAVTATVTDSEGNTVADGQEVRFDVQVLGTADPIIAATAAGVAKSTITPLAVQEAGVPVIVTAGDAQSSILLQCSAAPPPAVEEPPPAPPPPTGVIAPPATGSGGFAAAEGAKWRWLAALGGGCLFLATTRLMLSRRQR